MSEEMPVEGFGTAMEEIARQRIDNLVLSITGSKLFVTARVVLRFRMLEQRKKYLLRRGKRVS